MSLFSSRREPPESEPGAAASSADSLRRRGRLTTLARYAWWASIACGPLALVAAVTVPQALSGQPAQVAAAPAPALPAPTGYAELFVDLWLRSNAQSASAADSLRAMAPTVDLPQPSDRGKLSLQRVIAVRSAPMDSRTWLVTVAATMITTADANAVAGSQSSQSPYDGSQSSQSALPQSAAASQSAGAVLVRYYAVPVSLVRGTASGGSPDTLAITSVPAQVAGPQGLSGADSKPYDDPVQPGPLQQAVAEYLTAYLTGIGESARYLSPGVKIPAPGAVYQKVDLQTLAARTAVPATPVDGAVLDVLAQVRASDAGGQWPLAYPLQLKARAGRWEVAAMAPAAAAASFASPSPSSSPVPSAPVTSPEVH